MSTDRLIEHKRQMAQVEQLIRETKRHLRLSKTLIAATQETCAESQQFLATLCQRLRKQPPPR